MVVAQLRATLFFLFCLPINYQAKVVLGYLKLIQNLPVWWCCVWYWICCVNLVVEVLLLLLNKKNLNLPVWWCGGVVWWLFYR